MDVDWIIKYPIHAHPYLKVDWREKERMTSSGLQCEVCVFHFKWIKGERGWI